MTRNKELKLIYITRSYPPIVGGMEKVNYILSEELKKKISTYVIALKRSRKWLPVFFITSFFEAFYLAKKHKVTNIHIGDSLMSPIGIGLKLLLNAKVTVTVYGLDITYKNHLYQKIIPKCVNKLDNIICISNATLDECVKRGIDKNKCTVIHFGIFENEFKTKASREDIEKLINRKIDQNTKILITVGRLVQRKGVRWFIENVLPELKTDFLYLIVGNGPEKEKILTTIKRRNLQNKVFLLGRISDQDLKVLYSASDLFIMPNIPISGDLEGFGMVLIEAASAGLYSIASNFEGIRDAVINNVTGSLVNTYDSEKFSKEIERIDDYDKNEVIENVNRQYNWQGTVDAYINVFKHAR